MVHVTILYVAKTQIFTFLVSLNLFHFFQKEGPPPSARLNVQITDYLAAGCPFEALRLILKQETIRNKLTVAAGPSVPLECMHSKASSSGCMLPRKEMYVHCQTITCFLQEG